MKDSEILFLGVIVISVLIAIVLKSKKRSSSGDEDQNSYVWKQFIGRANDKATLQEKGKFLGELMYAWTQRAAEILLKHMDGKVKSKGIELYLDLVFVDVAWIDRIALEELGAEKRKWFLDSMLFGLFNSVFRDVEGDLPIKELKDEFYGFYNSRMKQYSSCTVIPMENPKTGAMEFDKSIPWALSKNLGVTDFKDQLALNIVMSTHFTQIAKHFKIRRLFTDGEFGH